MKLALKYFPIITFARPTILVSFLCVLCASVVNIPAQDFKTVHPGVEHAQVQHKIGSDPIKINLLRLDLTKVRLDVHHAMDAAIGTEKTSSIATRHGAVAAINAGFFRLDTSIFAGDASGLLIIDGETLSEPTNDRIVAGFSNGQRATEVEFGRSELTREVQLGKKTLVLNGSNRELIKDEIILYEPIFHSTTLTAGQVFEVIVRKDRIWQIVPGKGSSHIPNDGYVLSASGNRIPELQKLAKKNARAAIVERVRVIRISHEPDPPQMETFEDAVAGVPQLIKNGKIHITWEQEKASKSFVETRHPRTAVAKLKDGKFLMITVDGRQPGESVGMNLYELADYLLSLGAVDAMNLDGGGSTTMFLDGKVVNTPSDKEGERKIGDAVLVTLRNGTLQKPARQ